MWGLPQKKNARRAYKIRLCGHLRRYKKIVKKTYIILYNFKEEIVIDFQGISGYQFSQDCITDGIISKMLIQQKILRDLLMNLNLENRN